jgi:hypothetical protein
MADRGAASAVIPHVTSETGGWERAEMRCPSGKLFAMLLREPEAGQHVVQAQNLVEVSCRDCRKHQLAAGVACSRVLHRFAFDGTLVETLVVT